MQFIMGNLLKRAWKISTISYQDLLCLLLKRSLEKNPNLWDPQSPIATVHCCISDRSTSSIWADNDNKRLHIEYGNYLVLSSMISDKWYFSHMGRYLKGDLPIFFRLRCVKHVNTTNSPGLEMLKTPICPIHFQVSLSRPVLGRHEATGADVRHGWCDSVRASDPDLEPLV